MGSLQGARAKIHVDTQATLKHYKPCLIPTLLRERVEKELDQLQNEGIIEPVQLSDWAAPIVPIVKDNGRIRICGDYWVTINHLSKLDSYRIAKDDDLFAALAGVNHLVNLISVMHICSWYMMRNPKSLPL